MSYLYNFDKEKCWYKKICPHYDKGCYSGCVRYLKMHYLTSNALLTEKQQHPDKLYVEDIDKVAYIQLNNIKHNIVDFVNKGSNLFIYSKNTGNGKTQWSLKLLMNYFDKIWASSDFVVRGLFINVPRFLNSIKEDIREGQEYVKHIRDNILTADIVIWDELCTGELTKYEHENLLGYINARLDAGKSNIFTSNLSNEQLLAAIGDRLYSRIINGGIPIELKGKDKRGSK